MRFSPTLALASALAAAFTTTKQPHVIVPGGARRKIFYLHFHKAGGTSFCTLFRDAGLRMEDDGHSLGLIKSLRNRSAGLKTNSINYPPKRQLPQKTLDSPHCNCKQGWLTNNSSFGYLDAKFMAREMDRLGLDVCAIEEGRKYPRPDDFLAFAAEWHALGHVIVTTIRDPWARFTSNFMREHGLARASSLTIAAWAKKSFKDTPYGYEAAKYGAYNRPNFYVRLLNGLDRRGEPEAAIGARELGRAMEVLAAVDYVFLLEGDLQANMRKEMLGEDIPMQAESNNYFSSANLALHPERRHQRPETHSYRQQFLDENCYDIALHAAVRHRIATKEACQGCRAPENFFTGFDRSPHPRCVRVAEARANPAMWTGFETFFNSTLA